MQNKIVFGKWEAICLLINSINMQVYLNLPRFAAEEVGTAGWLLIIYVSVISFLLVVFMMKLYAHFPGKDIVDIGQYAGGSFGRIITGLIYVITLLFILSILLREFVEDIKIISLPVSPISYVTFFFVASIIAAAYFGLESMVRFQAIAVPIYTIAFLAIVIGVIPYFDISKIMPILGKGPYDLFIKGASKISIFSGVTYIFFLGPFLRTYRNIKTAAYTCVWLSAVFLTIGVLSYLLVYPYPNATENFLPLYQLARLIFYGRFFQRIEALFLPIWIASALSYLSMGFYFLIYLFQKTFGLKYNKPLILSFALLMFTISLLPPNLMVAIYLEKRIYRNYAWITTFMIPIVLLSIAVIKKKRQEKAGKKSA